jgi:alkylation response protein AidB-like acyl-CoA dehydrogenase
VEQTPTVEAFRAEARSWLEAHATPRPPVSTRWGEGSDSVAVFWNLSREEEREQLEAALVWHRTKAGAGFAAITWPEAYGGRGLSRAHERAFHREEAAFETPGGRELLSVTISLIAPTINRHGSDEQRDRFLRAMLGGDEMWCQLFSEPDAGSDLASLTTRATRDGDTWLLDGAKVWTSGAHLAQWGYILCRTDPDVPKHKGITAFLIPMSAPGVTVLPLRQMTGGASFNQVFLDNVVIDDAMRLGDVGEGWRVGMTTLGFERDASSGTEGGGQLGGTWSQVLELARHLERTDDSVTRQSLAELFIHHRVMKFSKQRASAAAKAGTPGPEGSIGKLVWSGQLRRIGETAAEMLGPRVIADTGEWGTYAWAEHVLGAPGYRVAGGSDEIQRNIIGERVLGLPSEPKPEGDTNR